MSCSQSRIGRGQTGDTQWGPGCTTVMQCWMLLGKKFKTCVEKWRLTPFLIGFFNAITSRYHFRDARQRGRRDNGKDVYELDVSSGVPIARLFWSTRRFEFHMFGSWILVQANFISDVDGSSYESQTKC